MRLDSRTATLAGGQGGPAIVPGKSSQSRLIELITGAGDDKLVMPPEGQRLSSDEIARLRAWIDEGATWPEAIDPRRARGASHWAFKRPERPAVPAVKDIGWPRNPIDAFVLARLEHQGLRPAPEADRATLLRRVSLDLTGLPPTPDEVERFLSDTSDDAYQRQVDRLLASPHFGERWARHWLDLARYADSSGYEFDVPRSVWRYRDWVIGALNRNMPFDQFAIEQLAGDLLPGATTDQIVASGFHCNAMLDPNLRWEAVLDQVNTTGTVFLGLTVGCAQCHSHKSDPISQREYYGLYAFFDGASIGEYELASDDEKQARDAVKSRVDELKKQRTEYEAMLAATIGDWAAQLSADEQARLPAPAQAALSTGAGQRSADQVARLVAARSSLDARHQELTRAIEERSKDVPTLPSTLAMRAERRETRMFVRGNPERPGELVSPGVPAFLHPLTSSGQPTRLELARWLVAPENPLVARVTMNRFWQHYFGRGLVETANDFGVQTPAPAHQELLDWLATQFVAGGWSMKAMHRLIVCSATYRQSSHARGEIEAADPANSLLARQRRLRVEAELVRDLALSASGLLADRLGGPSVFPFQPEGVLDDRATKATWTVSPGDDRYRRGLYTWTWRLTPHPMLSLFDAPDGSTACTRRDRSNTPVQALTLLNDPTFVQCAQSLARRVLEQPARDDAVRIDYLFLVCLGRRPKPEEADVLVRLLDEQANELAGDLSRARAIAGDPPPSDAARCAAWTIVCRSMLNLDEFLTRE